jgi:hypothetical protein
VSEIRIEIIAIGKGRIYSVGAVVVSPKGDVYQISKTNGSDLHVSRHSSGETHWRSIKHQISEKIRDGKPIGEFRGIEFLSTYAFGLESLPRLYEEYKLKKCNGIFSIDMREYEHAAFNMTFAILTGEALPSLLTGTQLLKKRQIYIFPDCHPMVAIVVGEARINEKREMP